MPFSIKICAAAILFTFSTLSGQDETGIKNNFSAYQEAFNKRDVSKLKALWAPEAIYQNLTTKEIIQGNDEIADYFEEEFENLGDETLNIASDKMEFPAPGKAIVKGIATTQSKGETQQKSAFVAELSNANGSWVLQKVTEVEIQAPPTHFEQLKELEWLVGKWEGSKDDVDFSIDTAWDENKNFLNQKFSIVMLDQKELTGQQIIGWDDEKKKIRSWLFDSDGGFGEGFWNKDGDSWYVGMTFNLPDGRKGSATQIYKKNDARTYTFAAEDRDIGGKLLPDTQPITITKIQ